MTAWFTGLRAIAWLKRIALAGERQAEALETLARISEDEWAAKHAPRPHGKFIVGTLDQKAANDNWNKLRRMEETGVDE